MKRSRTPSSGKMGESKIIPSFLPLPEELQKLIVQEFITEKNVFPLLFVSKGATAMVKERFLFFHTPKTLIFTSLYENPSDSFLDWLIESNLIHGLDFFECLISSTDSKQTRFLKFYEKLKLTNQELLKRKDLPSNIEMLISEFYSKRPNDLETDPILAKILPPELDKHLVDYGKMKGLLKGGHEITMDYKHLIMEILLKWSIEFNNLPFFKKHVNMKDSSHFSQNIVSFMRQHVRIDFFDYIMKLFPNSGKIKLFSYQMERFEDYYVATWTEKILKEKSFNILNWLIKQDQFKLDFLHKYLFRRAAMLGNIEDLEWLKRNNILCDEETFIGVIKFPHFNCNGDKKYEILDWLNEHYGSEELKKTKYRITSTVAVYGNPSLLEWFKKNGYVFHKTSRLLALVTGQGENLKWLNENYFQNESPLDSSKILPNASEIIEKLDTSSETEFYQNLNLSLDELMKQNFIIKLKSYHE